MRIEIGERAKHRIALGQQHIFKSLHIAAIRALIQQKADVNATLPGPVARVVVTPGATGFPDQYDIQLTWQEASESFNYRASTFVIAATP